MFALVPHQDFNQLGEELGTKYLSRLTQGNPILKDAFPPPAHPHAGYVCPQYG